MDRLKRIVTAALVMALLIFISVVAVRNWWGERLLAQAQAEQKKGNLNGASELYERALKYGKDDAAVALARAAYYRRHWDDVRRYARRAISINPLRGYVHILLAYTRAAEKKVSGVEGLEYVLDECRRAVALEPRNAGLWKSYADLALGLYLDEVSTWSEGADRKRYREETIEAYRRTLRFDVRQAREVIEFVAEKFPDDGFLLETIRGGDPALIRQAAVSLVEKGRWEEAREHYWREASSSDSPRSYHMAAAESLARARRHDEAFAAITAYLETDPDDGEAYFRGAETGHALGGQGWAAARELYLRALRLEPANRAYRRQFGLRLYGKGEVKEARLQLEKVVEEDPGDAQAYFTLGRIAEQEKDVEAALSHYRKALSLKPKHTAYRQALDALQ